MLRQIRINNFRGIKKCEINDLSLVNFFIGENNSGKSTILDAIYWFCRELANPYASNLRDVMFRRVMRDVGQSEVFYGYNEEEAAEVSLSFEGERKFSFKIGRARGLFSDLTSIKAINDIMTSIASEAYVLTFEVERKDTGLYGHYYVKYINSDLSHPVLGYSGDVYVGKVGTEILDYARKCRFLYSHIRLDDLWRELDANLTQLKHSPDLYESFCKATSDILGIPSYEFIPRRERIEEKRAAFKDGKYLIFGDFQGAGLQRTALILSTLLLSHNTAVFIEEIETYQHPKMLVKLAKHVMELAKTGEVQLFITTHSYNALNYFYYSFENEKERKEKFRCFLTYKKDGEVKAEITNVPEIIRTLYPTA